MKYLTLACLATALTGCGGVDSNPLYAFTSEHDKEWMRAAEKFQKECPNLQYYISWRKPIPEGHPGGPWTPDKVEKCIELYKPVQRHINPELYEAQEKHDRWMAFLKSDRGIACRIYYTTKDSDERDRIIQKWSIQEHNECLEYISYVKVEYGSDPFGEE